MAYPGLWIPLAGLAAPLALGARATARRLARARRGERRFLRHRARVLLVYHRLRDGRVHVPGRYPEPGG